MATHSPRNEPLIFCHKLISSGHKTIKACGTFADGLPFSPSPFPSPALLLSLPIAKKKTRATQTT